MSGGKDNLAYESDHMVAPGPSHVNKLRQMKPGRDARQVRIEEKDQKARIQEEDQVEYEEVELRSENKG